MSFSEKVHTVSTLTLQSLLSSISLLFSFPIFLAFLCVFPLFSKDFRGSAKRKPLLFWGETLAFSKKARIGGSEKSLVTCDSRFESQIAIAIKSRDLEHLDPEQLDSQHPSHLM